MNRSDPLFDGLQVVLRTRRARLRISQEAAACRAGISANYWGAIERGKQRPGVETLARIAHALHVSLTQLLEEAIEEAATAAATDDERSAGP